MRYFARGYTPHRGPGLIRPTGNRMSHGVSSAIPTLVYPSLPRMGGREGWKEGGEGRMLPLLLREECQCCPHSLRSHADSQFAATFAPTFIYDSGGYLLREYESVSIFL